MNPEKLTSSRGSVGGEYGGGGDRGSRRSRSRSSGDSSRGRERSRKDDWNRSTEAFLSNLSGGGGGGGTGQDRAGGGGGAQCGYPTGYPPRQQQVAGYPGPAQYGAQNVPGYPPMAPGYSMAPSRELREVRRRSSSEKEVKSRSKSRRKDSESESSDDESRKNSKKKSGITPEQRQKFKDQLAQYQDAREKLETQLLKLKEQREALKEGGAKHEDVIMKENARLQKEVKTRIQQMNEVIEKIEMAINQPDRSPSPSPSAPKRKNAARSPSSTKETEKKRSRRRSSSPEHAEEKDKVSKKKKKKKAKERSSSEDESERDRSKKKKRKKKKDKLKKSSSSDSSSDSESEVQAKKREKGIIQMDETMFRMLADAKSSKSSKKSDETLMDLLAKMSDAYMKSKHECTELSKRVQSLESENLVLKKQVVELRNQEKEREQSSSRSRKGPDDVSMLHKKKSKWDETPNVANSEDQKNVIMQKAQKLLTETQNLFDAAAAANPVSVVKESRPPAPAVATAADSALAEPPPKPESLKESRHGEDPAQERRDVKRLSSTPDQERHNREQQHPQRHESRDWEERGSGGRFERYRGSGGGGGGRFDNRRASPDRLNRRFENNRYDQRFNNRGYDDRYSSNRRDFRGERGDRNDRAERQGDGYRGGGGGGEGGGKSGVGDNLADERSSSSSSRRQEDEGKEKSAEPKQRSDKNDRINLDDWVQKPNDPAESVVDSDLASSLKQKMKDKEEKERQKEEYRKRWASVAKEDLKQAEEEEAEPEPREPQHPPLPSGPRPQVAIQWGQGIKRTTESAPSKKAPPVIGRMPGLNRSKKTPDNDKLDSDSPGHSRFGGPVLANVPPPASLPPMMHYGLTPEMYMQAITATMPTEPPENPPLPMRPPPKNPTPQNIDIGSILAAAQAHIQKKKVEWAPNGGGGGGGPSFFSSAAASRSFADPGEDGEIPLPPLPAAMDKDPSALLDTRPPKLPTPPPPKEKTEMELMLEKHQPAAEQNSYSEYGAYKENASTGSLQGWKTQDASLGKNEAEGQEEAEESMDLSELEMLGIDPNDFAGFGGRK